MKFTYASGSRPLDGYTIKRGIGVGGFGEVYYAVSDAGKEVALKLIRRHLDIELRGVRQCLNLKHPNLLGLYDIRTDGEDDRWVVMEYIASESLEGVLERNPNGLPAEEALEWMRGLTAGVAYLHQHGIVHRDLKPGNIFKEEGVVKIGDYGLSKFVSCSRRSGQTESVGTVHYMAPEIAHGRYGKEIDTYALGILLYEMLTGKVPFEGESVGEVLMKHLTSQPDLGLLAEPYRAIVARALAKDPNHRFQNAEHFAAELPGAYRSARPVYDRAPAVPTSPQPAAAQSNLPRQAPEEPLWRAMREGLKSLRRRWESADLPSGVKVALPLAGVILMITSVPAWMPMLLLVALLYGVYRAVWSILQPSISHDSVANVAGTLVRRPKSLLERIFGLLGSNAVAACAALTVAVVYGVFPPTLPYEVGGLALVWFMVFRAMAPKVRPGEQSSPASSNFARFVRSIPFALFASTLVAAGIVGSDNDWLRILAIALPLYFLYQFVKAGGRFACRGAKGFRCQPDHEAVLSQPGLQQPVARVVGGEEFGAVEPLKQKAVAVSGSMLLSAAVALTLTVVLMLIRETPLQPVQFAWLAIVGTLGSWAVIVPSSLWERKRGEQLPRRFTLFALGLLVGAIAFQLANYLDVPLHHEVGRLANYTGEFDDVWGRKHLNLQRLGGAVHSFYNPDGTPRLVTFLAYFGVLLLALRWWRLADSQRKVRLRLWSVVCAVFAAWIVSLFWPFPQPWGWLLAAIMAVSVQLASPWEHPSDRKKHAAKAPVR